MISKAYVASKFAFMLVLIWLVAQAAISLRTLANDADATLTDARRVILVVGGLAGQVRTSLKEFNKTEATREAYYNDASRKLADTLTKADKTVADADTLLVSLNAAVNDRNVQAAAILADADASIKELDSTAKSATKALDNAASVVGDPNIPATVAQLEKVSENLDGMTKNLDSVSAHVDATAADVQSWVHGMIHPAKNTLKTVGKFVLDTAEKFGNIIRW